MTSTRLELYTRDACQPCAGTKRAVTRHALDRLTDVVEFNTSHDEQAATVAVSIATEHNLRQEAPIVVVRRGGTIVDAWSGYRPDKLKALAGQLAAQVAPAEFLEADTDLEEARA